MTLSLIVLPVMAVVLVLLIVMMFKVKNRSAALSNEALRWDAISPSPINSLISATLRGGGGGGLITIRAFKQQEFFMRKFMELVDENGRAFFTFIASSRWLSTMLDFLVYSYVVCNLLLTLILSSWVHFDPSLVAMSISILLEVGGTFQYLVRVMIEI